VFPAGRIPKSIPIKKQIIPAITDMAPTKNWINNHAEALININRRIINTMINGAIPLITSNVMSLNNFRTNDYSPSNTTDWLMPF